MTIREDLIASAAQFLQEPSVASSSIDNKISFLRAKNLTPEEIDASLSRARSPLAVAPQAHYAISQPGSPQQYYPPQYVWQQPSPPPRRDWRDWFIIATVISGMSFGLYSLSKRYICPLIAPPTSERLEQDKKSIEEQFDRAFALVEQLAKDSEALKLAEEQRTERLDAAMAALEEVTAEVKAASRRREDDARKVRDEIKALKGALPKAVNSQKSVTESRLSEINVELTSLKALVSQRMTSSSMSATSTNGYSRASGNGLGSGVGKGPADTEEDVSIQAGSLRGAEPAVSVAQAGEARPTVLKNSGASRASIPAWQMAAAMQSAKGGTPSAEGSAGGSARGGGDNAEEGGKGGRGGGGVAV